MTTLTDHEISAGIAANTLVLGGIPARLGPASYELRMGTVYYDLTESARRIEVSPGETILIKPGHHVVLITSEQLMVPNDMIARIVSKGSLFSIGLSPVSTYGDPGFIGNLGIVTQNISDKYIEIPIGEPIAKVDFSKLSGPVDHPYTGQHGYQTEIWPIKTHLQKTYDQVCSDPRVESEKTEAYKLLPQATAEMLRRMERRQLTIDVVIFGALAANAVFLLAAQYGYMGMVAAIATNLASSAIAAFITLVMRLRN